MPVKPLKRERRQSEKGFGAPPQFKAVCFTYGVPLLFLAAALAIHFRILEPLELGAPLGFMSLPVVIAAIYFGFRPAMLVTVLGGVVIACYRRHLSRQLFIGSGAIFHWQYS